MPTRLDIKAAEENLDALIERACLGEDIVINEGGVSMVRLVPVDVHSPGPGGATVGMEPRPTP